MSGPLHPCIKLPTLFHNCEKSFSLLVNSWFTVLEGEHANSLSRYDAAVLITHGSSG